MVERGLNPKPLIPYKGARWILGGGGLILRGGD